MTKPRTALANWLDGYTNRAGQNIAQALHNLATDIGLHDHEESGEPGVLAVGAESSNPARDGLSTSRAHDQGKSRSETSATDTESGATDD
ncbi:hypothetical protein [Frondihabitans cladoniiphilus]|uniref:Uncharacterized protein n=1 Tax=Frondihabitans cladoniiphilus TaxID=715785 RepID=A0ABP8WD25_9MICO